MIVPDPTLTLKHGAIKPWRIKAAQWERRELFSFCEQHDIPTDVAWQALSQEQQQAIMDGEDDYYGVRGWFKWLETKTYKMHVRVFLARYRAISRVKTVGERASNRRVCCIGWGAKPWLILI